MTPETRYKTLTCCSSPVVNVGNLPTDPVPASTSHRNSEPVFFMKGSSNEGDQYANNYFNLKCLSDLNMIWFLIITFLIHVSEWRWACDGILSSGPGEHSSNYTQEVNVIRLISISIIKLTANGKKCTYITGPVAQMWGRRKQRYSVMDAAEERWEIANGLVGSSGLLELHLLWLIL